MRCLDAIARGLRVRQDQVRRGEQVVGDLVSDVQGALRLGEALARPDEDAPAAPGVDPGQDVADHVADHPGGAEVQAELLGRTDQHARPGLPVAVLDDGPIVAGRGFRAEVDRVDRCPLCGELAVHLVVDQVQLRLGEHPPADGRLVGHHDAGEPRAVEPPQGLGGPRQEADAGGVGQVVDLLDHGSIAVEEHGRPLSRPGGSRRGEQAQAGGVASGLLQRLGGADVEVIALPGPPAHPADEPGEDLEPEVERPQGGDLAVGVGRDDVDPRVGQVAPRLARLLDERDDAPHVIQLGDPAGPRDRARGTGAS